MIESVKQFVWRNETQARILTEYTDIETGKFWYEGQGEAPIQHPSGQTIGARYRFEIQAETIEEAFGKYEAEDKTANEEAIEEAEKRLGISKIIQPTQVVNLNGSPFDPKKGG